MAWNFTVTSCMDDLGRVNPSYMLKSNPKFVVLSGDFIYSNMGTSRVMKGVTWDPDIFWVGGGAPVNARTYQRLVDRYELWNGINGCPEWSKFWTTVRANNIPVYAQADDHDFLGDNWDFSLTSAVGSFPGAGSFGQVVDPTTTSDVLNIWRIRNQGWQWFKTTYLSNPPSKTGNKDIPANMVAVSGVSGEDFPIDYFYKDFGANGEAGGTAVRVIFTDSLSYKSIKTDPETSAKTFLGATQTAWMQSLMLDAKTKGFGMVILVSTKDIFGNDNLDGMGNYTYWRDNSLLTFIENNNIPCCVVSGDKHLAHTSIARKANGDITDLVVHCSSPFGSRHSDLAQHKQLVWAANRADMPVYETVTIDGINKTVTLSTMDGYDNTLLCQDVIPWGSRLPTSSFRKSLVPPPARLGYIRTAISVPASTVAWQNTTGRAITVTTVGGTVSDISVSQDGTTFDSLGVQRQVILQNGDSMKVTYTVAPTMFWCPILDAWEK